MKTVLLGDIHGRKIWKDILLKEQPSRIVFLGDYFDSYNISGYDQLKNFEHIISLKLANPDNVILLLGNHDVNYFTGFFNSNMSGFQPGMSVQFNSILEDNKHLLQMAYKFDNFLCTHAGVSPLFMTEIFGDQWNKNNVDECLNDLWKYRPLSFRFRGLNSYGNHILESPVWIRPRSLMKAGQETKKDYIQIVGHTQVEKVDIKGKATGGRYFFIDSLEFGQYLVIEESKIKLGKI